MTDKPDLEPTLTCTDVNVRHLAKAMFLSANAGSLSTREMLDSLWRASLNDPWGGWDLIRRWEEAARRLITELSE